jgi:hypothetical protein
MAIDTLYKLANSLEDELGGGARLEEAANSLNLKLTSQDEVDNKEKTQRVARLTICPAVHF